METTLSIALVPALVQGAVQAGTEEAMTKAGAGAFGPVPMAPNGPDKINDAELKATVEVILKS